MYNSTQQRQSTGVAPSPGRGVFLAFGARHIKGVAAVRWIAAVCFVIAGVLVVAFGHWWGLVFFVAAALNGSLAYLVPRWNLLRDAPKNVERVRELQRSRALVVDDAAARLRRIEQDLHDGAQAQMVAVVMKLGLARDHLSTPAARLQGADLDRALELVDAAQRGAMEAINELRDLARGIHPPALDEGLDAALAGLAARSELPVDLVVELSERPSLAIETIAYFCAAELITNAAKHSGAQNAKLEALHHPGLVTITVSDDGTGGARLESGGGLAGLAERVETVDGRLRIESPAGGPTVVSVELPSHV
jgi:signal transduction histidine kinase